MWSGLKFFSLICSFKIFLLLSKIGGVYFVNGLRFQVLILDSQYLDFFVFHFALFYFTPCFISSSMMMFNSRRLRESPCQISAFTWIFLVNSSFLLAWIVLVLFMFSFVLMMFKVFTGRKIEVLHLSALCILYIDERTIIFNWVLNYLFNL